MARTPRKRRPQSYSLDILRLLDIQADQCLRAGEIAASVRMPRGSLHTTLDRLEEKGLVTSSMVEREPRKRGRTRRLVTITKEGERACRTKGPRLGT